MLFACKDIQKSYGVDVILEKISLQLEEKEKAAIVGVNGAGKTTLFRIIAGKIAMDSGDIFLKKDTSIGYLEQNVQIDSKKTIYDEMLSVFDTIISLESELREMESKMASLSGDVLSAFMEQYAKLQHQFEELNGYGYQGRIRGVLKGLGFPDEDYCLSMEKLSGGQKTRIYLGKLLLSKPDLLLLDEPTNHLDIDSIQWLEDFLRSYSGAVLLISHDRYFMDRTVAKIIEIENKKSKTYDGNYTKYIEQKEVFRQIQLKQFTDQQKELKHQEEVIKTLRSFNREKSIKRAESREKALNKIERIEKPDNLPDKMRLTLSPKVTSGNDVLYAENLSKSFDQNTLFQNVAFDIKRGEKIAIIGPNGVGKSTLFKIILKQLNPDTGYIKMGVNVHLGYYDQELQTLDETKTIFQEISDAYPTMTNGQIRNVLAAFVFTGDDIFKPISALSGGEKGRLSLAKIMLSEANLLMLDEPTNHLDMYSKEILENAINHYEGTVIYISHDRYFINRTAEKILELTHQGITKYLGNYTYYLEKKNEASLYAVESVAEKEEPVSAVKLDWQKQKEEQAKIRKRSNQISKIETQIEETEKEMNRLDALLFEESVSTDPQKAQEIFEQKQGLEASLNTLYDQWAALQD